VKAPVPRLARFLLGLLIERADRDAVLEDMEERFRALASSRGPAAARRWYWSQTVRALPALLSPDAEAARRRAWQGTAGDLRFAVRSLRRRPMYAVGVIGTLALGLGAAAAVGSVAWHVWLAPLPFLDPSGVVRLYEMQPADLEDFASQDREGGRRWRLSPPLLEDFRHHEWSTITAVAGLGQEVLDWAREGENARVTALAASPEFFSILGLVPVAGRALSGDEDVPEVVLTRPFWERAFGADPVVSGGGTMMLDGVAHTIVGVFDLPAGYPPDAEVITRLHFGEAELTEGMRGARYLDAIARVEPTASVGDASAEVDRFVRTLAESFPAHREWGGEAVVLGDDLVRPYRAVLALLLMAGGTFLTLAVVNVGGLIAARRIEGRHERAIRMALGASEGRLVRHAAVEGWLVGAMGALAGLLAARWLLTPIRALVPSEIPRVSEIGIDAGVGATILLAGMLAGIGVGVLSYALSRRTVGRIGSGRTSSAPGLGGRRLLVVGQLALTTLMLTAGVAILRHLATLRAVDLGFTPDGIAYSPAAISQGRYPTKEAQGVLWSSLVDRLGARGVEAAVATNPPMAGSTMPFGYRIDAASEQDFAQYHSVTPGYFSLMGIEVVEGRPFGAGDDGGGAPVVVVGEQLARRRFPGGAAVGREIRVVSRLRTIVGVVRSTRHFGPGDEIQDEMYVPLAQDPWAIGVVLVKSERADVPAVLGTVLEELDPDLHIPALQRYTGLVAEWYAPLRLQLVIVGVLALIGLALASLGLFALVSYHVTSRRREIGIRLALGAPSARLLSGVLGQGVAMLAVGLTFGLGTWYAAAPYLGGLMEGVDLGDRFVPVFVAFLVAAVAGLATLAPAWKTTSVDPASTLQSE
jgi:putative ABC transport system permease protein